MTIRYFLKHPTLYFDTLLSRQFFLFKLVNLTEHFKKVEKDITNVIADPDFQGIGIIDLEYWRPVFDRNWDPYSIYRFEK